MKKLFILVLILLTVGCSKMQIRETIPLKESDKTVYLEGFPYQLEMEVENSLINNGWDIYAIVNNVEVTNGNIKKEAQTNITFLIKAHLTWDILWYGKIEVIDLRTGKAVGSFLGHTTEANAVKKINEIIRSIEK